MPPVAGSPTRRPGSVRRTSSVDILRPEGLLGPLVLAGSGRDLRTDNRGHGEVVDRANTEVVIDFIGNRLITSVATSPEVVGIARLIGVRAGSGFRRQLSELLPELAGSGSLTHLLLDEVPPATLISGSALVRAGLVKVAPDGDMSRLPLGICSGWRSDGEMQRAIQDTGIPLLGWGPPAPKLTGDDVLAWHEMDELVTGSMRRCRRIDLWREGEFVHSDVRYRDTYWGDDGTETVVHEYGVTARFEVASWSVASIDAVPGPLPAPECPAAAASIQRIVGLEPRELRAFVRESMVGVPTCTHLNDVVRSLADVAALARHL